MKRAAIFLTIIFLGTGLSTYAFDSYEDFLKQQASEYENYIEEIDREFTDFLKKRWTEFDSEEPQKVYEKPKPKKIPVAKPEKRPEPIKISVKPKPKPVKTVEKPVVKPKPEKVVEKPKPEPKKPIVVAKPEPKKPMVEPKPIVKKPDITKEPVVVEPKPVLPKVSEPAEPYKPFQEGTGLALSFYGHTLDIPYDENLKTTAGKPLNSNSIANWWKAIAGTDYKKSLKYMQKFAKSKNLGDWGLFVLFERFAAKLIGDKPERKMLVWFFMNKSGFDAKLGYMKSNEVKIMVVADSDMYGVTFYTFDGKRYYVIDAFGKDGSAGAVYTYRGKYPDAKKVMKLKSISYPDLGFSGFSRDLKFKYNKNDYKIRAFANKYGVAFWNNFPQADLEVYTQANTPQWMDKVILPELKKIIKGKSNLEAVNIILRFVQTAFEYKTDDAQFGYEKFLFAEETIYYPYSDCEDRSVMFAYIVRKLLGLDVVMLDFPNHIATAVNLGKQNRGAVLHYKGKGYSVTDPTYINASAGMIMPRYKNVSPMIIEP